MAILMEMMFELGKLAGKLEALTDEVAFLRKENTELHGKLEALKEVIHLRNTLSSSSAPVAEPSVSYSVPPMPQSAHMGFDKMEYDGTEVVPGRSLGSVSQMAAEEEFDNDDVTELSTEEANNVMFNDLSMYGAEEKVIYTEMVDKLKEENRAN